MGIQAHFAGRDASNPTFTICTRSQPGQPWHKDYASSSVGAISNGQSFSSQGGNGTFRGQIMVRVDWSQNGHPLQGDVVYQIR